MDYWPIKKAAGKSDPDLILFLSSFIFLIKFRAYGCHWRSPDTVLTVHVPTSRSFPSRRILQTHAPADLSKTCAKVQYADFAFSDKSIEIRQVQPLQSTEDCIALCESHDVC